MNQPVEDTLNLSDAAAPRGGQRELAAQRMFGAQAPVYAASAVHINDASLELMQQFAAQSTYGWAVDLGTGAGFTAFAMARYARWVLAIDPTLPMLHQARRGGLERRLTNLGLSQNVAEALPISSGSVDLVTSRVAAHHFADLDKVLDEVRRVLRPGGVLLVADSVAPEDGPAADWMNDVELRRDFSHVRDRKVSELESMLARCRMPIVQREFTRIHLQFNNWVERTATPQEEVVRLRRDFLKAPAAVQEAFQIQAAGGDIHFSWPCLVFRAVK
jgi:ubiquinone/menaquinone biosynthesis C-methylase UbiE